MSLPINQQKEILKNRLKVIPVDASAGDRDRFDNYETLMISFANRNKRLAGYIKKMGWLQDSRDDVKLYLVVDSALMTENPENLLPLKPHYEPVVMYFGLKCGQLYLPDNVELGSFEETFVDYYRNALALGDKHQKHELVTLASNFIDQERIRELEKLAEMRYRGKIDRKITGEKDVSVLVNKCFPALELTHFVKNEAYQAPDGIDLPLGEYIFWELITPKIQEISKMVGLQYLYLFAATENSHNPNYVEMLQTMEENRDALYRRVGVENKNKNIAPDLNKLIKYYKERLHFHLMEDKYVLKPSYDYTCFSMVQSLDELKENREKYNL